MTLTTNHRSAISKLPPHAVEAERAMLGCILLDDTTVPDIRALVPTHEWMMHPRNAVCYKAMLELYAENQAVDVVLLNQRLEDCGLIQAAGGQSYLIAIAHEVPTPKHAKEYARAVREKHLVNQSLAAAGDLIVSLHSSPHDLDLHLGKAIADLQHLQRLAA